MIGHAPVRVPVCDCHRCIGCCRAVLEVTNGGGAALPAEVRLARLRVEPESWLQTMSVWRVHTSLCALQRNADTAAPARADVMKERCGQVRRRCRACTSGGEHA
eukprot:10247985-Lingulodinium_polyedra.AAC.2